MFIGVSLSIGAAAGVGDKFNSLVLEDTYPVFVFDPENGLIATRDLTVEDYALDGVHPTFIFDPENRVTATRNLGSEDYKLESAHPVFVFDPENRFIGTR